MASTVLPNGIIIPEKYSRDWYNDLYHNWQELDNLLGGGTPKDGTLTIQKNGSTVGTFSANQATDETVNIEVPDVNNGTLTIQKNGTDIGTFSANQATDETVNIEVPDVNNGTLTIQKNGTDIDTFTANSSTDKTVNISVPTNTSELTNGAGFITADYAVPRGGGAVITGDNLSRVDNNSSLNLCGGTGWSGGATINVVGKSSATNAGVILLHPKDGTQDKAMFLFPSGTWTWDGTAVQITSDQRYKQQISEIDDKLLDAWEDVNLVQFKYNDAVDQKGNNARLHTGYVVQQIDNACKSHNVDISQYGLYCHEVYPEETEEVEVEQADGTKTKERRVIREANEHYSLRYTEVYAVECMYLRRCIARLTARIEELEKGNNTK